MKKVVYLLIILALSSIVVFGQSQDSLNYNPSRLIIRFNKNTTNAQIDSFFTSHGLEYQYLYEPIKLCLAIVPESNRSQIEIDSLIGTLATDTVHVQNVHKSYYSTFVPYYVPNDPAYADQWQLENGHYSETIDFLQNSGITIEEDDKPVIAVLDRDFYYENYNDISVGDHVEFDSGWKRNNDEIPNDGFDNDNNGFIDDYVGWDALHETKLGCSFGHGTRVSGMIIPETNNDYALAGFNNWVKVMPIAVLKPEGSTDNTEYDYLDAIIDGLNYIKESKERWVRYKNGEESSCGFGANIVVVNMSFGIKDYEGTSSISEILDIMTDLGSRLGILFIAAAGNEGENLNTYDMQTIDGSYPFPQVFNNDYLIKVTGMQKNMDGSLSIAGGWDSPIANYGFMHVDMAAPSAPLPTLDPSSNTGYYTVLYDTNGHVYSAATSKAAPQVAAEIGLINLASSDELKSMYNDFLNGQPSAMTYPIIIKNILKDNSTDNSQLLPYTTWGKVLDFNNPVVAAASYSQSGGDDGNGNPDANGICFQQSDVINNEAANLNYDYSSFRSSSDRIIHVRPIEDGYTGLSQNLSDTHWQTISSNLHDIFLNYNINGSSLFHVGRSNLSLPVTK